MNAFRRFIVRVVQRVTLVLIIAACHTAFAVENESQARPDLTGTVQDENGQPVANATVFIYTAGPKEGSAGLCPSCYADCRKRATTDAGGKFMIRSLDPELRFRILVVVSGSQPKFVSKVDPAAKPIVVTLKPTSSGRDPNERLRGQVVDSDGKPVPGAVVSIRGVTRAQGTQFGGNEDVDPVAVTDSAGKFSINSTNAFDSAGVDVEARGFAKAIFQSLATGDTEHTLKLTEGTTVKGRVVKDGQPMAGVEVGVAGADRNAETYVGDFAVATDKDGNFLIANLPPKTKYFLYGLMESLEERGCIPARPIQLDEDGSTLNVGDVEVKPGFVIAGQIKLRDGKPIPPKTRVLLGREQAWDTRQLMADETGHFRFTGVPAELVDLSVNLKGYRPSARNASLDLLNSFELLGRVVADKSDLVLELEPGQPLERDDAAYQAVREQPLRGAEAAGEPNPGDIKVTGTVLDAETQKPISAFSVTEGRPTGFNDEITWITSHKTEQSNGTFTVYLTNPRFFMSRPSPPALLIEADGYLPQSSGPIDAKGTNLVMSLKKGSGPSGVVLNPDGSPAANVKVCLTDMKNGVYVSESLDNSLRIQDQIYRGTSHNITDAQGHFSFPPGINDYAVVVLADAGFAEMRVSELEKHPEVRLQNYGHVEGRLMIGTRPGSNETVRLGLAYIPYEFYPRQFPPISMYLVTKTDRDGHFSFNRVPPLTLQVSHEPKVRDSRMGIIAESQTTKFVLHPGETRHLELGGKGRPVIGRFVVTNYEGEIDYRADVQNIETIVDPPAEMPDMRAASKAFSAKYAALTDDDAKTALRAEFQKQSDVLTEQLREFYKTDAGRKYYFAQRRFALNFSQDGSFRIEDVPGGKYNLRIEIHEGSGDSPDRFAAPVIASFTKEIDVPDASADRLGDALDLGTIQVSARTVLRLGKAAPDFSVKTLDDKPLKLSDFRGKYVLLDFWATWCGPCVAETPNLKATWDAFKGDPRFAMVGMSLDPDAAAPRNYAKKNDIGWTQCFLGEWSKTDVPATFGVEGIPAIFLIGPDGKIIGRDLRGEAIKSAVAEALKKN